MANELRTSIFGSDTAPDDTGDVFLERASVKMTTAPWGEFIAVFKDTSTRIGIFGSFQVPDNYSSATTDPAILIPWSSGTNTNNVVFDFDYRAHAIGEGFNQSGTQQAATVTDVAPGTAWDFESAVIALTRANFVALDIVKFALYRDGVSASDTHAADIIVQLGDVVFRYEDA